MGSGRVSGSRTELLAYGTQAGMKVGTVMWPVRVALSGQQFTPGGAIEIAEILGKEETLRRMGLALEKLENCGR